MANLVWRANIFIAISIGLFPFVDMIGIFDEMVYDVFIILKLVEFFLFKIHGYRLIIALVIVK